MKLLSRMQLFEASVKDLFRDPDIKTHKDFASAEEYIDHLVSFTKNPTISGCGKYDISKGEYCDCSFDDHGDGRNEDNPSVIKEVEEFVDKYPNYYVIMQEGDDVFYVFLSEKPKLLKSFDINLFSEYDKNDDLKSDKFHIFDGSKPYDIENDGNKTILYTK